jgi:universal stress protein A
MKIEHILVPTDCSDQTRLALDYAVALRDKFPARLTLLHIVESIPGYGSEISIIPAEAEADRERAAVKYMQELAGTTGGEAPHTVCLRGSPWRVICDWAEENGVDLIVMPTHGYSGLLHLWLGSVAERVVQKAKCPVLTVRSRD